MASTPFPQASSALPSRRNPAQAFARMRASRRKPRPPPRERRHSPTIPAWLSMRWAGPNKDFAGAMKKIENLLQQRGATDRSAHFVCALCVAWPDNHLEEFEARVDGALVWPPRGKQGFGYDPIFVPHGHTRTFGEMSADEKHSLPPKGKGLSHRARAFLKLAEACLER